MEPMMEHEESLLQCLTDHVAYFMPDFSKLTCFWEKKMFVLCNHITCCFVLFFPLFLKQRKNDCTVLNSSYFKGRYLVGWLHWLSFFLVLFFNSGLWYVQEILKHLASAGISHCKMFQVTDLQKSLANLRNLKRHMGFPGGSDGKESACDAWDLPLIPRLGRSPGEGNGNLLQYSCLENPHGQRRLAGYSLWGCKELDTDWATKQKQQQDAYRLTEASKGRSEQMLHRWYCKLSRAGGIFASLDPLGNEPICSQVTFTGRLSAWNTCEQRKVAVRVIGTFSKA